MDKYSSYWYGHLEMLLYFCDADGTGIITMSMTYELMRSSNGTDM